MTVELYYHDFEQARDFDVEGQPFALYVRNEEEVPADVFETLHRHAGTDEEAAIDTVFERWNAGSGRECEEFARRECEDCEMEFTGKVEQDDGYVIDFEARQHDAEQHERATRANGDEHTVEPGTRSLSVGDVVVVDGEAHLVAPFGFSRQPHLDSQVA